MEESLSEIRDEIGRIDRAIIELLSCRLKLALDLEQIKRASGLPVRSPEREKSELAMVLSHAQMFEPTLPDEFIVALMTLIFETSVSCQESQRAQAAEQTH